MKTALPLIAALLLAFAGFTLSTATADDASQKKEVLAAMEAWKNAMMKKDEAGLKKIFHDDLQYGHSTGEVQDKPTTIKRDITSANDYTGVDFLDTKIAFYGNTAVVTGKNIFHITAAGKKQTVSFTALAVWEKSKQGWQLLARQVTRLP